MKKIVCFLFLLMGLTSCYPPRIIYTLAEHQSIAEEDSIEIHLLKVSTISLNTRRIFTSLSMEIINKGNSFLVLNNKSRLQAFADSVSLDYQLYNRDTLPLRIEPKSKKKVFFSYTAEDSTSVIYNAALKKHDHILKLSLDFQDGIQKDVIFNFLKTRRFIYEGKNRGAMHNSMRLLHTDG